MTVYGYVRVKPDAIAGTANTQGWWMRYHGCEEVYADVWRGEGVPPALDMLLDAVCPGDEVRVPEMATFGPTKKCRKQAEELFTCRGVQVSALGQSPPEIGGPAPPVQPPLRMAA